MDINNKLENKNFILKLLNKNDFNLLYDKGFRICAIESFEDVLNNSIGYESSELHSVVYNAIMDITDEEFDKQEFVNFLKGQDEAD